MEASILWDQTWGGGQRGRWVQGGWLEKGGVFAGGWEARGREGQFGGKERELQMEA